MHSTLSNLASCLQQSYIFPCNLPSSQSAASGLLRLVCIYEMIGLQDGEATPSSARQIEQSPFAEVRDVASSSGSSNPPESRATGVPFGQSPAPDVVLLRRSTGKSKPVLLPAFSEEVCANCKCKLGSLHNCCQSDHFFKEQADVQLRNWRVRVQRA